MPDWPVTVFLEKIKLPMPTLRTLAWKCRLAEGGGVPVPDAVERVELEPSLRDGTLLEDDKGIRFSDANVMVRGAAQNVLATEDAALVSSPKACFIRLDEIWAKEIGKEETVSGHVLSALHNSRVGRELALLWRLE